MSICPRILAKKHNKYNPKCTHRLKSAYILFYTVAKGRNRYRQKLPNHYHLQKTEDIINRAGGILVIRVFNSLPDGSVDREGDVRILTDGIESTVPAGTDVEIRPGNSMTIYPGLYHLFTAKPGCGDLIVGEVSSINDDRTDNYFEIPRPRFIPVEEDTETLVPLCNEYDRLFEDE